MANVGIYDMTDTWGNAGTTFTAIKMNVTDVASAAGSKLLDIQIGGSSYLELNKSGELGILDKIFHLGDTNTAIRFPANDTISFETSSGERMRIDSSGRVGIGVSSPAEPLEVRTATVNTGMLLYNTNTNPAQSAPFFMASEAGSSTTNVSIENATSGNFVFRTGATSANGFGTERMRITSAGDVLMQEGARILGRGAFPTTDAGVEIFYESNKSYFESYDYDTSTYKGVRIAGDPVEIGGGGYLRLLSGTGGIQFNGDTAAANALDDYEEGTWTPSYTSAGGAPTATYNVRNGGYTKIGRAVMVTGELRTTSYSGGSGTVYVTGLPFTASSLSTLGYSQAAVGFVSSFGGDMPNAAQVVPNTTDVFVYYRTAVNGAVSALDTSDMSSGASNNFMKFSAVYFV